ncbi:MAG: hypothetical protein CVV32_12285 [Methanomicrobiales archaeon HGW-Methanomicrobiales-3]|nr:MAG: hypothetical protein CVV32_12285 [Methanomicrobiales archaeon HGW-Methanomicrobiales-3]
MSDNANNNLPGSGNKQRPLILVVDDRPENLALLSAMLSKDGADVRVANAGPVALRYARLAPQPDLILLDIMMPEMDGHAVLAELLKDEQTRDIPVIFVTALGEAEDEERGFNEGAVDYITKPIKHAVLRARVWAQLEIKHSRDLQVNQQHWLESEVQRRVNENSLLESRLQLALAATGLGVWEVDHEAGKMAWSAALCQIFGCQAGPETVTDFLAMIHPDDLHRVDACLSHLQADAGIVQIEYRARAGDDQWRWIECRGKVIRSDAAGQAISSLGTMADITRHKSAEADRLLASAVFQGISDGVCITDANGLILLVNQAFCQVTGYAREDVLGHKPSLLKSGIHGVAFYHEMWEKINRHGNWQGEITNRRKDGSLLTEWLNISSVRNADAAEVYYVGIFSDLSERHEAAERIQFLATFDALTGLPNRNLFADRLDQALPHRPDVGPLLWRGTDLPEHLLLTGAPGQSGTSRRSS